MKQDNRGGYRPGSGRKPKDPDDKRVQMVVSVDPDTREKLKEISRVRNIKPGKVIDEMVKGEW